VSYLLAASSTDSGNSESPDVHSHPDGTLQKLWEGSSVRQFKAGQHVFRAGDAQLDLYKVESGTVRLYKNLADGRRQVIGFRFAGDLIGLELQSRHLCSAQAVVSARLHCVPTSLMRSVALEDARLLLDLYSALSNEMAAAQDLALSIGRRDPDERLAGFLVNLSRRNERRSQDPTAIELLMPRTDIADHLGLTIETVSRTLGKLAKQRLINLVRRRSVRILDMDALEALMDGLRRMRRRRRNKQ
jgi:CRP/FNR family transcriptional regulator, anaerobic regulatory protein